MLNTDGSYNYIVNSADYNNCILLNHIIDKYMANIEYRYIYIILHYTPLLNCTKENKPSCGSVRSTWWGGNPPSTEHDIVCTSL